MSLNPPTLLTYMCRIMLAIWSSVDQGAGGERMPPLWSSKAMLTWWVGVVPVPNQKRCPNKNGLSNSLHVKLGLELFWEEFEQNVRCDVFSLQRYSCHLFYSPLFDKQRLQ